MMRKSFAAAVASAVALVGFAGSASAAATVALRWADGTDMTDLITTGQTAAAQVVLIAGQENSDGAAISIDYSAALGVIQVMSITERHVAPLSVTGLGSATDQPAMGIISNLYALCFGLNCLQNGQSYVMGTIVFQRTGAAGSGNREIAPFVDTSSTDGVLDGLGSDITGSTSFVPAFVNVPEPGAVSLLVMGLGGMLLAGRGRRS